MIKRFKSYTTYQKIFGVLAFAVLCFIWIHSCASGEDSAKESGFWYNLLKPYLEIFMGKGNVTHNFVRKFAHFTEFAALGFCMGALAELNGKRICNAAFFGLFVAVVDETIQLFSLNRGSSVKDVWIDTFGCLFGILCICILLLIIRACKKKKSGI